MYPSEKPTSSTGGGCIMVENTNYWWPYLQLINRRSGGKGRLKGWIADHATKRSIVPAWCLPKNF
jgi:hypothetical protein